MASRISGTTRGKRPTSAVIEVARLAAEGLSNKEIAEIRRVAPSTVSTQVQQFYAFIRQEFPNEPLISASRSEIQLREALPQLMYIVLRRFPELSVTAEIDDTADQPDSEPRLHTSLSNARVEIGGLQLDFGGRGSAILIGSTIRVLLEEAQVDTLLQLQGTLCYAYCR